MIQPLWAPWRLQYILSKKGPGCIFCEKQDLETDRDNLILCRGSRGFVMMNLYPYNNGHLMVVPFRHVYSLTELSDEESLDLMKMTQRSVRCLKEAFRPEGFNIGVNIGKVAGAGIEEHLHFHVIPRWVGDTHFMAVLGEVRVIPEHVLSTYDRLLPLFNRDAAKQRQVQADEAGPEKPEAGRSNTVDQVDRKEDTHGKHGKGEQNIKEE